MKTAGGELAPWEQVRQLLKLLQELNVNIVNSRQHPCNCRMEPVTWCDIASSL